MAVNTTCIDLGVQVEQVEMVCLFYYTLEIKGIDSSFTRYAPVSVCVCMRVCVSLCIIVVVVVIQFYIEV